MAFQKVNAQKKFYKLDECEKGQILAEGIYVRPVDGRFGVQYEIRDEERGIVVLGGGHLKYQMETSVDQGDYVRITYDGKVTLDKGNFKGRQSHQFVVEVDKERSLSPDKAAAMAVIEDESKEETASANKETLAQAEAAVAEAKKEVSVPDSQAEILAKYKNA